MSGTPAEIQACVSSQCPRETRASEPCRHSFIHPPDTAGSLDRLEHFYREHLQVKHIAVFGDLLGQRVALVVSRVSEDDMRRVLDDIASRSLECACIADFVALQPHDPLVFAMFPAGREPRRDLVWRLLVGCIETLTFAADRMTPTGERPSCPLTCSRMPHRHDARRGVG